MVDPAFDPILAISGEALSAVTAFIRDTNGSSSFTLLYLPARHRDRLISHRSFGDRLRHAPPGQTYAWLLARIVGFPCAWFDVDRDPDLVAWIDSMDRVPMHRVGRQDPGVLLPVIRIRSLDEVWK